ncbi:poly [ADP-ribose] polymerase 2-like isoform X2 [Tachypleus tridentatus]|uniref:poly [ADP-ribose] polymerase 2-like isoform X2 n=1 Tax=Tachypleus tridentatus TaxID=6853 RepID=UPI003FD5E477
MFEEALKKGEVVVSFTLGKRKYTVDLKALTELDSRKRKRTIHRVKYVPLLAQSNQMNSSVIDESTESSNKMDKNQANETKGKRIKPRQSEAVGVEQVKTVVIKGKAPVDSECTYRAGKVHVYCEGSDVYDALLNQTNLQNNNNKYYIIQLLKDDDSPSYSVWFRWGRVGKKGQHNLVTCGNNLEKAKATFKQKFEDKTKNFWESRQNFEKVHGKYDLIKVDYSDNSKQDEADKQLKPEVPPKTYTSKLDIRLQRLIELVCNVQAMEDAVMEMQYDAKKAPLGKLTSDQIKAGYSALKAIEDCINKNEMGSKLVKACNDFYTRIPHDFGMKRPPLIQTRGEIRLKLQLLETLGDIQVAIKMLREEIEDDEHPLDRHYHSLQCSLEPLNRESEEYKVALGTCNKLVAADNNADKLPPGTHSVMGQGRVVSDPQEDIILSDGTRVPLGKSIQTNIENPQGYTLNYNEYVVYNVNQIKMRYLVRIKFNFK